MWNETDKVSFIVQFLPPDATLLWIEEPNRHPAILTADLDGDNTHEMAAAFRWQDQNGIILLKWYCGYWYPSAYIQGKGYGITYLGAAPLTAPGSADLIIGWQQGAIYSQLDLEKWNGESFQPLLSQDIYFSEIEVISAPPKEGQDKRYALALWTHDTGNAYRVEIYQWNGKELVPYPPAYKHYFPKVVDYYQKQLMKMPDAAFYWYYLADAQAKSQHYNEALRSVQIALKLNPSYPSKRELESLHTDILSEMRVDQYLYPAIVKTKNGTAWGYINKEGVFVIKPQYDYANDFQANGLAIVEKNNLSGLIDRYGRYIVPPKYINITQFSEGRAVVIDNSGFKVMNESGKILTPKPYSYISMYQNDRAVFNNPDQQDTFLYGYLDRQCNEIIPMQYMYANDFMDGQALVQLGINRFALIDLMGRVLHTYNYASVNNPGDGLLPFQPTASSKYGYIDVAGNVVISPQYGMALPFSNSRAVVNAATDYFNKFGLIDKNGHFIIQPIYNDVFQIGESRVAVGKAINPAQPYAGSNYAIADLQTGKLLTDFLYSNITEYNRGYLSVSTGDNTFFLDRNGSPAQNLPSVNGDGTLSFVGDLIRASADNRTWYLGRDGKVVWQQNTIIPLNDQWKVIEEKFRPDRNYIVYYPQLAGLEHSQIQAGINEELKRLSNVKTIANLLPLHYSYSGDFSVEFFRKNLLVLELDGYQYYLGAAHGIPSKIYPNIDLITGQFYQLKDLFKADSNYVKILSEIIGQKIKTDPQYSYVFPDEYKGIAPNQPFYVNGDALFIYFMPYEIAPFSAGFPTFRIPFKEIMPIVNEEGAFWKAFH
jgi:hypothetical protein